MNRIRGILAAGTLTGLVAVTALALGPIDLTPSVPEAATPAPEIEVVAEPEPTLAPTATAVPTRPSPTPAATSEAEAALKAWQTYSGELEASVRVLQEREAQYNAELQQANATIRELQVYVEATQANAQAPAEAASDGSLDGGQQSGSGGHEDEHEDHEGQGEHSEGDHEEHDD